MYRQVLVRQQTDQTLLPASVTFPGGVTTETTSFSDQDNYTRHYQQRMQSFLQGFELLINAQSKKKLPEAVKETAILYAQAQFEEGIAKLEQANAPTDNLEKSQQILDEYTSHLTTAVVAELGIDAGKAVRLLDKAEQYAILSEPRPALVSVSKLDDFTVVQMEEPLPALSDDLLEDYYALVEPDKKFVDKPEWYRALAPRERTLLDHALRDIKYDLWAENIDPAGAKQQIRQLFSTLSSKLRTIPGPPNLSRTHLYVYDRDGNLVRHQQRLRSSMISSRDVLKQRESIRRKHAEGNLKHIIELQVADQVRNLADSLGMTVPALLADDNFSLPILVQTLITPQVPFGFTPDNAIHLDKLRAITQLSKEVASGDYKLMVDGHAIPKEKVAFFSTNHPQNLRMGSKFYSTFDNESPEAFEDKGDFVANAKSILELMDARIDALDASSAKRAPLLKNRAILNSTIEQYEKILTRGMGLELQNREMILSSLEQMTAELTGGLAYGSCVSGKDRKGLETLHTNAMWLYVAKHNAVPDMDNETQREAFAKIFAQLFVTRHQQENAGQNAPGANGIKTPTKYLPGDILDAIKELPGGERLLTESDRLATNNDAKKCIKALGDAQTKKQYAGEYQEAKQLLVKHYQHLDSDYRQLLSAEPLVVNKNGKYQQTHGWVRQQLRPSKKFTDLADRIEAIAKQVKPASLRQAFIDEQARHVLDASFHAESTREHMEVLLASQSGIEPSAKMQTQLTEARSHFAVLAKQAERIAALAPEANLRGELMVLQEVCSTFAKERSEEPSDQLGPETISKVQQVLGSPLVAELQKNTHDSYIDKLAHELDQVPTLKSFYNPNFELLNVLEKILDQQGQWKHSAVRLRVGSRDLLKRGEAKGIQEIRQILSDDSLNADKKVSGIIRAVEKRGASKVTRQANVNTLYGLIKLIDKQPTLALDELSHFLEDMQQPKASTSAYVERFNTIVEPAINSTAEDEESGEGLLSDHSLT